MIRSHKYYIASLRIKYNILFILFIFFLAGCKKQSLVETEALTVTFNSNGGSAIPNQTVKMGETISFPKNPEKNVWIFENWYINEEYKEVYDAKRAVNASITLHAKWIPGFKTVSTFAGDNRGFATGEGNRSGYADGIGNQVYFWGLGGINMDASGTLWVNEYNNRRIRKITPSGQVITIAGSGKQNYKDGMGIAADFQGPGSAMAIDSKGNLFIIDSFRLRKITPQGEVTTIAGNGLPKAVDGKGVNAGFWTPSGMVCDANDNIILTEFANSLIRKITPDGTVITLCKTDDQFQYRDGPLANAGFRFPAGICINSKGDLFVADQLNNRIRKISNDLVSTFAGSGEDGYADGRGVKAKFSQPERIVVDRYDNLYVSETLFGTSRLRMISPEGEVSTVIGSHQKGFKDGSIADSKFDIIRNLVIDNQQNLYIMDDYNSLIRKISR